MSEFVEITHFQTIHIIKIDFVQSYDVYKKQFDYSKFHEDRIRFDRKLGSFFRNYCFLLE